MIAMGILFFQIIQTNLFIDINSYITKTFTLNDFH